MGTRAGLAYPEGNPAALTASAGRLSDLAARIERASASIAESIRVSGWEGHRYGVFTTAGRALADVLGPGAAALRRTSSELTELATELKDAQRRIEAWADEIEAAQRRFRAAGSALNAAMFANPLGAGAVTSSPGSSGLGRAQAAYERAASELDELRAHYLPKARQLCERLRQEDERTASTLRTAAASAPKAASGAPSPLSFFDLNTDASAGFGNRDGTFGGSASASIEAILARLHKEFDDGASTTEIEATVGANAEASAKAEVGPGGLHLGAGGQAQAGAKAELSGTLGDEGTFALKPSIDGRLGPGVEAGASIDADGKGLHFGVHAGASAVIGGGLHLEVDVDPGGLLDAAREAPRTIEKIKDILG